MNVVLQIVLLPSLEQLMEHLPFSLILDVGAHVNVLQLRLPTKTKLW